MSNRANAHYEKDRRHSTLFGGPGILTHGFEFPQIHIASVSSHTHTHTTHTHTHTHHTPQKETSWLGVEGELRIDWTTLHALSALKSQLEGRQIRSFLAIVPLASLANAPGQRFV
jgi:hypothetical protein